MVNIGVGLLAIALCTINAAVWTLISQLPYMGAIWLIAAVACVKLQKWSWSPWKVRF